MPLTISTQWDPPNPSKYQKINLFIQNGSKTHSKSKFPLIFPYFPFSGLIFGLQGSDFIAGGRVSSELLRARICRNCVLALHGHLPLPSDVCELQKSSRISSRGPSRKSDAAVTLINLEPKWLRTTSLRVAWRNQTSFACRAR